MRLPFQYSAKLLRALSHPVRLTLLDALGADEECVCHLAAVTGKRQAYVSQQLACLRRAGLVKMRKDGLRVYYRVDDPRVGAILQSLLMSRGGYRLVRGCDCPKCADRGGSNVAHQNSGSELRQLSETRNVGDAGVERDGSSRRDH